MKSKLIKITKNYQVTLPAKLRSKFSLKEGDYLEASAKNNTFVFKPKKFIDTDPKQEWFWTKEWQKKEHEADKDIKKGKIKSYNNMNDFIKELKAKSK